MSRWTSITSRLTNRIRQDEIEEDPTSLSARAFRQRLLGDEPPAEVLSGYGGAGSKTKVAVYQPKPNRFSRRLLRIGLTVVAPLVALALILWVTFSIVSQNQVAAPVQVETTFDSNVPVPAGVRVINRATSPVYNQKATSTEFFSRLLPLYTTNLRGVVSYISPQSVQDLNDFYNRKLVGPKPPPWQVYGKPTTYGDFYTTFYIRSLSGTSTLEGVLVQLQPVNGDTLKQDPSYYDRQAKLGETVIILSKAVLSR